MANLTKRCDVPAAVAALSSRRIIKERQSSAHMDHRWHSNASLTPLAVCMIQNDGPSLRVPVIYISAPIDPNGFGVFAILVQPNMVGEEEPRLIGWLEIRSRVFNLLFRRKRRLGINCPLSIQILCSRNRQRPKKMLSRFVCERSGAKEH